MVDGDSPALQSRPSTPASRSSSEVRMAAEWATLEELVRRNPGRLTHPTRRDTVFSLSIVDTPALRLDASGTYRHSVEHDLRIHFPRHFPALPMEAYLVHPIFHPNAHPETGFLCLWDRHVTTNTVEHAVHKTVAMLAWRLLTTTPLHVMQPEAMSVCGDRVQLAAMRASLDAPPLHGNDHHDGYVFLEPRGSRRRRLS
jgi:ubiquitin-protein ligase